MTELTKVERLRAELAAAIEEEEAQEEINLKNRDMMESIEAAEFTDVTHVIPEDKRIPESVVFNTPDKTVVFKGDQLNILRDILHKLS
jgi:hypothetical protein